LNTNNNEQGETEENKWESYKREMTYREKKKARSYSSSRNSDLVRTARNSRPLLGELGAQTEFFCSSALAKNQQKDSYFECGPGALKESNQAGRSVAESNSYEMHIAYLGIP
jgi:hypothetical protein